MRAEPAREGTTPPKRLPGRFGSLYKLRAHSGHTRPAAFCTDSESSTGWPHMAHTIHT
jgi:hypothetical protein